MHKYQKFFLVLIIIVVCSTLLQANAWLQVEKKNNTPWLEGLGEDYYRLPILREFFSHQVKVGFDITVTGGKKWSLDLEVESRSFLDDFRNIHDQEYYNPVYQSYLLGTYLYYKINDNFRIFTGAKHLNLYSSVTTGRVGDWSKAILGVKFKKGFSKIDLEATASLDYYYRVSEIIRWEKAYHLSGAATYDINSTYGLLFSFLSTLKTRREKCDLVRNNPYYKNRAKIGVLLKGKLGGLFIGLTNDVINIGVEKDTTASIGIEFTAYFWKYK